MGRCEGVGHLMDRALGDPLHVSDRDTRGEDVQAACLWLQDQMRR